MAPLSAADDFVNTPLLVSPWCCTGTPSASGGWVHSVPYRTAQSRRIEGGENYAFISFLTCFWTVSWQMTIFLSIITEILKSPLQIFERYLVFEPSIRYQRITVANLLAMWPKISTSIFVISASCSEKFPLEVNSIWPNMILIPKTHLRYPLGYVSLLVNSIWVREQQRETKTWFHQPA